MDTITRTHDGPPTYELLLNFLDELYQADGRVPYWVDMNVDDVYSVWKSYTLRLLWRVPNAREVRAVFVTCPSVFPRGTAAFLTYCEEKGSLHRDSLYFQVPAKKE